MLHAWIEMFVRSEHTKSLEIDDIKGLIGKLVSWLEKAEHREVGMYFVLPL